MSECPDLSVLSVPGRISGTPNRLHAAPLLQQELFARSDEPFVPHKTHSASCRTRRIEMAEFACISLHPSTFLASKLSCCAIISVCVLHLGEVPCVTYQVKALMALSPKQYALWQLFLHKLLTLVKTEFALTPSLIYWRCTSFPDT